MSTVEIKSYHAGTPNKHANIQVAHQGKSHSMSAIKCLWSGKNGVAVTLLASNIIYFHNQLIYPIILSPVHHSSHLEHRCQLCALYHRRCHSNLLSYRYHY